MNTSLLVSSLLGAMLVIAWRMRETRRPITAQRIVVPPLGMSAGFSMFVYAPFRIPALWAVSAFALGALVFSYPLMKSSKLMRDGDVVRLHRSRGFIWIVLGLAAIRLAARGYCDRYISPLQSASTMFVLAFGMIAMWRVRMFVEYRKLRRASVTPVQTAQPAAQSEA
jgi:membrane protein CcdC involved in cytochrome C biogenesis